MADQSAATIKDIAEDCLNSSAKVKTDNARGFSKLREVVKSHKTKTVKPKQTGKELPWVHITISNAKRNLLNTYHHVDDSYLQNYLDEFTYKLNRRYLGDKLFERLVIACISFDWFI